MALQIATSSRRKCPHRCVRRTCIEITVSIVLLGDIITIPLGPVVFVAVLVPMMAIPRDMVTPTVFIALVVSAILRFASIQHCLLQFRFSFGEFLVPVSDLKFGYNIQ